MSECLPFRWAGLCCAALSTVLAGCSGIGSSTLGGRPFVYKQGPGDAPSDIEDKAGVVYKHEPVPEPASRGAPPAAPARAQAPVAAPEAAPVAAQAPKEAPRNVVAQAAPRSSSSSATSAAATAAASSDLFSRYTQATRYGDLLFVSGQIAIDQASGAFDPTQSIEVQTHQVLENIRLILESHQLTMANVVYATVYLSSISQFTSMDAVYHGFFKGTPPARAVVEVGHLPRGALVEIAVIAGR
jgi:2-iminobutanoate/2-iminopropanoate deaminase